MDTPERQEGPQHPWQGWWGRQRVRQRQRVGQHPLQNSSFPCEILLKYVLGMSQTVLAGGSGRCWQIWGKKGSLLQVTAQPGTDHNKGAHSIAAAGGISAQGNYRECKISPGNASKSNFLSAWSSWRADSREREQDRSNVLVLLPADVKLCGL